MKRLGNKHGFALITTLMFSLIATTIIMALLYMITASTAQSGMHKRYRTALDASVGGSQIILKEVLPNIMQNFASTTLAADLATTFSATSLSVVTTSACLQQKFTAATASWGTACSNTLDATNNPDMTLSLAAINGSPYTLYAKVVDTSAGNSDLSGVELDAGGVTEGSSTITPQSIPYIYRLEITAQRASNAIEKSKLSVSYAY